MRKVLNCIAAAFLLAACGPDAGKTPNMGGATAQNAAAEFKLEPLENDEGNIQGCQTILNAGGGEIFRAGASDKDAVGFLKIDGALIELNLIAAHGDEARQVRSFESADKKTSVVESLATGQAYPESDSVEQTGTLAVKHGEARLTFDVSGGTAC
jgi:hypothetical protein